MFFSLLFFLFFSLFFSKSFLLRLLLILRDGWIEGANFFRSVSSVVVSYKVEKERDKKFKKKK